MSMPLNELLPQERQARILQRLKHSGRVVANDLATEFGISEDSIRRDLREMAASGLCRRVYGGALLPTPEFPTLAERIRESDPGRSQLAATAASIITPGQIVLIDAGSTNVEIASVLRGKGVSIVTNSPAVALAVADDIETEVIALGGKIDVRCGGAIGAQAIAQLSGIQADVCIPGTCTVDPETGVWGVSAEETAFKQAMIRSSGSTIVTATVGKLGSRGAFRIAALDQVDHLVVTADAPSGIRTALQSKVRRLHVAGLN